MPSVASIVIIKDDKLLMELRKDGIFFPGKISFPGGKLEHDEHPYDAAVREAREELGITVVAAESLPGFYYLGWMVYPFYVTRYEGDTPSQTDEGDQLLWVEPHPTSIIDWLPARLITENLLDYIKDGAMPRSSKQLEPAHGNV